MKSLIEGAMSDAPIEIRKSNISGNGVFATKDIKEEKIVFSQESVSENLITSIDELKDFYASVKYLILNPVTKQPFTEKEMEDPDSFDDQWRLLSVEQILKLKIGICYDTAMMTDHFLTKWNIEHLNIFAGTKKALVDKEDAHYATHAFVIYKKNGLWHWLEGSWHSFIDNTFSDPSSDNLIKTILKALANSIGMTMVAGRISAFPAPGTPMKEFFTACDVSTLKYKVSPDSSHSREDMEEADLKEYGTQLLIDLNEGCAAFEAWVNTLQASHIYNTTESAGVKQIAFSIAQENVLTETVSAIFKKIGQFIAWFCQKIHELWNYLFGYTQRKCREFNSNYVKIQHFTAQRKFFNQAAFDQSKVPNGLILFFYFDKVLQNGWYPDEFFDTFKTIMDLWENDPQRLFHEFTVGFKADIQHHPFYPLIAAGWGVGDAKSIGDILKRKFPAKGTMMQSGYFKESCDNLFVAVDQINGSYQKVSKLFTGNGNILMAAAKRSIEYSDRTDLTEHEALKLADVVQKVSAFTKNAMDKYSKSYLFILEHGILVETQYLKFVK